MWDFVVIFSAAVKLYLGNEEGSVGFMVDVKLEGRSFGGYPDSPGRSENGSIGCRLIASLWSIINPLVTLSRPLGVGVADPHVGN